MYKSLRIQRIFFLLLLLLAGLNSYAEEQEDDNIRSDKQTRFSVHIDSQVQVITGIQTTELVSTQYSPEIETFAIRVDITPLINTRNEYLLALAKQKTASIKLEQAKRNVQRLKKLQREKAVSIRKLHDQQTLLKIEQARFDSFQQQTDNIRLIFQAQWGNVLSHWFLTEQLASAKIQNILTSPLYLVSQPTATKIASKKIYIQAYGYRDQAQSASLVGIAPAMDASHQQTGSAYYYLSDQPLANLQQRVVAWLPVAGNKLSGVTIPASSLVWHLGQAFVYLKIDNELFKRIKITYKELINSHSYFIQHELQQGDLVVSTGAQMILSEEFRGQIPAEDDDDDD